MPFVVLCLDKPGVIERRNAARAAHIAYLADRLGMIRFAGPLNTDDGQAGIGSLYVLEVETRAEAERFVAEEPYCKAELFESVVIRRWRHAIPEANPGQLKQEIERAKAAQSKPA